MESKLTPEELTLVSVLSGALIGSILGPIIIELLKLRTEPKRKERYESEVRYQNMLMNLTGFYADTLDKKKIETFYEHYRVAWLYVPDEVIESINDFLIAVGAVPRAETEPDKAARKMILAARRAFKGKTKLKPEQFLIIGVPEHKKT